MQNMKTEYDGSSHSIFMIVSRSILLVSGLFIIFMCTKGEGSGNVRQRRLGLRWSSELSASFALIDVIVVSLRIARPLRSASHAMVV
jgi:hypothetical protein